jgi:hypothetical protein
MLAQIVGQVDWNSAAVLCVAFITICIAITTAIGKRRSKAELSMQFEIDKQKLRNADEDSKRQNQRQAEYELAKIATERDVQFRRIDSGLIEGKVN